MSEQINAFYTYFTPKQLDRNYCYKNGPTGVHATSDMPVMKHGDAVAQTLLPRKPNNTFSLCHCWPICSSQ